MTAKIQLPEPYEPVALPKEAISISIARSLDDLMQVMSIRSVVYMGEQLCPYDEEFDGKQKGANSRCLLGSGSSR